jgi:hypothetical protein
VVAARLREANQRGKSDARGMVAGRFASHATTIRDDQQTDAREQQ